MDSTLDKVISSINIPEPIPTPTDPSEQTTPLSKNAIKKAAKAERFAAHKAERRAREKEVRKEKKKIWREKRDAGELDPDEESQRAKKKPRLGSFGGRVVVDLGFDEKMTDKEVVSLCSQLGYTYSANRQAGFPFTLLFTGLNGRTYTRLEGMSDAGYSRWTKSEWWKEGYDRLWGGDDPSGTPNEADVTGISRAQAEEAKRNVIYLTADSTEELTELKPTETYIIGGIVDHNRYKNLCLDKALAHPTPMRTARLPIGTYLTGLPTRKVLTVNQVFEILANWVETRNWEESFYAVIPKRKFVKGKTKGKGRQKLGEIEADEDEEPAEEDVEQVVDVAQLEEALEEEPGKLAAVLIA